MSLAATKPNKQASAQDHACHLQRRLLLWTNGKVEELLDEALCIQNHLPERSKLRGNRAKTNGASDTIFSKLVFEGKIKSANRYLTEDSSGVFGIVDYPFPDSRKTVREILLEKHPVAREPPSSALLQDELQ